MPFEAPNLLPLIYKDMDFSKSSDGIGAFLQSFAGGYKAGQERKAERAAVDEGNDWAASQGFEGGLKYPKRNVINDVSSGINRGKAIAEQESNPLFGLQQMKLMSEIQGAALKLKFENMQLENTVSDQRSMAVLMDQLNQDPDFLAKGTPTAFKTPQYQAVFSGIQRGYNASVAAKQKNNTLNSIEKSLLAIGTESPQRSFAIREKQEAGAPMSEILNEIDQARFDLNIGDDAADKAQSTFGKLLADRAGAQAAGRADEVKLYDQQIAAQGAKQGFKIQFDDQGRAIINYGPGAGDSTIGDPTVATQSGAQRKLLKYEAATELMNHLQRTIKPEYLGVRGSVGEIVVDRGLSQLVPEMADKSRVDFRSSLIAARESLLREISDDTRFSNVDREEIAKALPSSGIFESLPDAQQRLDTVRRIITQRGKTYSDALGLPAPIWSMSKEEIKKQFDEKKITQEQAIEALERFH